MRPNEITAQQAVDAAKAALNQNKTHLADVEIALSNLLLAERLLTENAEGTVTPEYYTLDVGIKIGEMGFTDKVLVPVYPHETIVERVDTILAHYYSDDGPDSFDSERNEYFFYVPGAYVSDYDIRQVSRREFSVLHQHLTIM